MGFYLTLQLPKLCIFHHLDKDYQGNTSWSSAFHRSLRQEIYVLSVWSQKDSSSPISCLRARVLLDTKDTTTPSEMCLVGHEPRTRGSFETTALSHVITLLLKEEEYPQHLLKMGNSCQAYIMNGNTIPCLLESMSVTGNFSPT